MIMVCDTDIENELEQKPVTATFSTNKHMERPWFGLVLLGKIPETNCLNYSTAYWPG
jgi:hypothetical protein